WYVASAAGQRRLSEKEKFMVRTTNTFAERFIYRFKKAIISNIPVEDRSEIYSWIKKILPADKIIEDIKKQKFNFIRDDF
ncbi:uncharacterized protein BO87DRAFT_322780, partial [Aspergillus neoniger CBS 115656]